MLRYLRLFQLYNINKYKLKLTNTPIRKYIISEDDYIVDRIVLLTQSEQNVFLHLESKDINSPLFQKYKNIYIKKIDELDYMQRQKFWHALIERNDANFIITSKTNLLPVIYEKYFDKMILPGINETNQYFSKLIAAIVTEKTGENISHLQKIIIELNGFNDILSGIDKLSEL